MSSALRESYETAAVRQQAIDLAVKNARWEWSLCIPRVARHGWSPKGSMESLVERDMRAHICAQFREIMAHR